MGPVVCPTVLANNISDYRKELERIQGFVARMHIDFMDGVFAPTKSISITDAWWQTGPIVDLHVMYQKPLEQLENLVALHPDMIIIHAEAEGYREFFHELEGLGIKKGLALLHDTPVDKVAELLPLVDHVLIFSGELGKFGGTVDLALLEKVKQLRQLKPTLEIGWDGGINAENVSILAAGGINVLNVGGYIQKSQNPENAYDTLVTALKNEG